MIELLKKIIRNRFIDMTIWLILFVLSVKNLFQILDKLFKDGDFSLTRYFAFLIFLIIFFFISYHFIRSYIRNFGWQYKANSAYDKGDIKIALKYFSILTKIFRWNSTFLANRGNCYYMMGKWQLAINDYTKALKLKPKDGYIYKNRANAYKMIGFKKHSDADYAKAKSLGIINK